MPPDTFVRWRAGHDLTFFGVISLSDIEWRVRLFESSTSKEWRVKSSSNAVCRTVVLLFAVRSEPGDLSTSSALHWHLQIPVVVFFRLTLGQGFV